MVIRPCEPIKLTSISQSDQNLEEAESNNGQLINQGNNLAFCPQFNLRPSTETIIVFECCCFRLKVQQADGVLLYFDRFVASLCKTQANQ